MTKNIYCEALGCPKNDVDISHIQGTLLKLHHNIVSQPEMADTIIINTCSFIEAASKESIQRILELSEYKQTGHCQKLIVAGCLVERYSTDIQSALPEVDFFLGTGGLDHIQSAIEIDNQDDKLFTPSPKKAHTFRHQAPRLFPKDQKTAYIRIAEGCSLHCTYCIIPKLRGPYQSVPIEYILNDFNHCLNADIKEIILVAQDTASYGKDLQHSNMTLSRLLIQLAEKIESLNCKTRIRILYMNPQHIDDTLIQTIKRYTSICPYVDMPIQHACDDILKTMNRPYTKTDLYRLIEKMRSNIPNIALRTSLLVGFPGEKENQFQELIDFVQDIQFDHLGVFDYSDSDDLASHHIKDHVDDMEKEARHHELMTCQADISYQRQQRYVGQVLDVLTEELSDDDPPLREGRTVFQAPEIDGLTLIAGHKVEQGKIYPVRITQAMHYDLLGEIM